MVGSAPEELSVRVLQGTMADAVERDSTPEGLVACAGMSGGTSRRGEVTSEELARWMGVLPQPLAASLDLYRSRQDPGVRVGHLLDFYEASAAFVTCVLLGTAVPLAMTRRDVAETLSASASFLERTSFGNWVRLGETIATALGDSASVEARLFATSSARAEAITATPIWRALRGPAGLRNVKGHTAQASPARDSERLAELESRLPGVVGTLADAFAGRPLVYGRTISYRAGLFHNHVYMLVGQDSHPVEADVILGIPLEEDRLYLVDLEAGLALALPPLLVLVVDRNFSSAVCFWSKAENGKGEFVSRHLNVDDRHYRDAAEVREYLDSLAAFGTLGEAEAGVGGPGADSTVAPEPADSKDPSEPEGRAVDAAGRQPTSTLPVEVPQLDPTTPGPDVKAPTPPLRGRALGAALHPLLEAADPLHLGLSAQEALTMATATGIAIGGGDPLTVVASALKITDGFKRVGPARWTWIPIDRTVATGLSGADLRDAALGVAKRLDPDRRGLSLDEIGAALQREGRVVKGPHQAITLWRSLASPPASECFAEAGPGRYVWTASPQQRSGDPAAPVPSPLAAIVDRLDAALPGLDARIARRWIGDNLTYFLGDDAFLEVRVRDGAPLVVIETTLGDAPHTSGVVVEEVATPGVPPGQGPVAVEVDGPRAEAAVVRLAAAAAASSAGNGPGTTERERWAYDAVHPWISVDPPFLRGCGTNGKPRGREPGEGWEAFWRCAMSFAGVSESPLRGRRPTRQPYVGTSGRDGVYAYMILDAYGPMAIYWYFARRTTPAWIADFRAALPAIEAELRAPLVVGVHSDGATFVVLRAEAEGKHSDQPAAAASALRRLTDALAPWTARLGPNR